MIHNIGFLEGEEKVSLAKEESTEMSCKNCHTWQGIYTNIAVSMKSLLRKIKTNLPNLKMRQRKVTDYLAD